jgi:hypothetical protein
VKVKAEIESSLIALLPKGRSIGWVIPRDLCERHELPVGPSQVLLPQVLTQHAPLDVFLHDSDHCYPHMIFELSLAWLYLRSGGWLLCDNMGQNAAFFDFTRGINGSGLVIPSFDSPSRVWKHGLIQKPL